MMKLSVKELRKIIKEELKKKRKYDFGGSQPEENYEIELLKDPSYKSKSVYVPDDIKKVIDKWAEDMLMKSKD